MTTADIDRRLTELHHELDVGRQTLAGLDAQVAAVRSQMLRISGAIQALQELKSADDPAPRAVPA
jgi:prefoldin subunit 5